MRARRLVLPVALLVVAIACMVAIASTARARPADALTTPKPVPIPASHQHARDICPLDRPLACRAALIHAYEAVAWQRKQNVELAREMLGNVADWTCIHNGKGATSGTGEGSWTDAGDPYWGGLQMDRGFMRTYGADMIRRHHGGLANTWTPREQIIVAERARASGRGYNPWPTTGRACGLVT